MFINSSSENRAQEKSSIKSISLRMSSLMLQCRTIEGRVKYMLQVIDFQVWLVVVFDCFNGQKFLLVDPIHKFPRALFFVGYFLNFEIEESMFGVLDHSLEGFPIL